MQCQRKFKDFCKDESEGLINGVPCCNGCKEKGEEFDR